MIAENYFSDLSSLVITQYQEDPRFIAYMKAYLDNLDSIANDVNLLIEYRDPEDVGTQGYHLDVIGDMLGVSRYVGTVIFRKYMGFRGAGSRDTWQAYNKESNTNPFYTGEELGDLFSVDDNSFKTAILFARKCQTSASKKDISEIFREGDSYFEEAAKECTVHLDSNIFSEGAAAVVEFYDVVPRPLGVKYTYLLEDLSG